MCTSVTPVQRHPTLDTVALWCHKGRRYLEQIIESTCCLHTWDVAGVVFIPKPGITDLRSLKTSAFKIPNMFLCLRIQRTEMPVSKLKHDILHRTDSPLLVHFQIFPLVRLIQPIVSPCEVPNKGKQSLKVGSTQTWATSVHTNANQPAILLEVTSSKSLKCST